MTAEYEAAARRYHELRATDKAAAEALRQELVATFTACSGLDGADRFYRACAYFAPRVRTGRRGR
jgi:hypothetical protein